MGHVIDAYEATKHIRDPDQRRRAYQQALKDLESFTPLPDGAPAAGDEVWFIDPADGAHRSGVVHAMARRSYGAWVVELDDGDRMRFLTVHDLTDIEES